MQPLVPDAAASPDLFPRPTLVAIVALTALTTTIGVLPWPRPPWVRARYLVAVTPPALWALVAVTALACIVTAVWLTVRTTGLRLREPAAWALVAVVFLSAGALMWNALYAASLSGGPVIPIFHWLFTLAPSVLGVVVVGKRGRRARVAAALGTGVVTLPLLALGWSLLVGRGAGVDLIRAGGSLWLTAALGVAPLIAGVAFAAARWENDQKA